MSSINIIVLYETKPIFLRYYLFLFLFFPILTEKNKIQNNRYLESTSFEMSVKIQGNDTQRIISPQYGNPNIPIEYRPHPDIFLDDTKLCENCYEVNVEGKEKEDYTFYIKISWWTSWF